MVLGALVAGTGTVVVSQLNDESAAAVAAETAPSDTSADVARAADAAAPSSAPGDGSADVPLMSELAVADLQHVAPASRGLERDPLVEGVTFTVVVDGVGTEITSGAATLADALSEAGIVLGWEDEVSADISAAPEAGAEVHVGRATTQYVTDQVVTEHAVEERRTSTLLEGETRVVQEGVDGDERVTSEVRLVDGVEVSRTTIMAVRSTEPVTEIVELGTRKPAPAALPSTSGGSTGGGAPASTSPVDPGTSRAIAKDMVLARGWGEEQWACLDSLWQKESNWNHTADNPSSSAYGIPQALPGSKMSSAGADWATNPATQIAWGLSYIDGRYGTPCGAWDHSKARNWY